MMKKVAGHRRYEQGARSDFFSTLSVGPIVPVGAQVCPYESNEPSSTFLRVIQPA
jgi:hypothetical protein